MSETNFPAMQEDGRTEEEKRIERIAPYRFKKGQSGNPTGKAKGLTFTEIARIKMRTNAPKEIAAKFKRKRMTWAEVMVEVAFRKALVNVMHLDKVLDRVEGKARQQVEISGPEKKPVAVDLSWMSDDMLRKVSEEIQKAMP